MIHRIREAGDIDPVYMKTQIHWGSYCNLYGVLSLPHKFGNIAGHICGRAIFVQPDGALNTEERDSLFIEEFWGPGKRCSFLP
jgi:hypothetical protein